MNKYPITITCSFGLESFIKFELKRLNIKEYIVENGKIFFDGSMEDICRCNLWLRCADRVFITMYNQKAHDFDEYFAAINQIRWEDIIPENGAVYVTAKSKNSALSSVPVCQSMGKKAIIEAMKRKYKNIYFQESGPVFHIDIELHKDNLRVSLDTSGQGLHKRGYRLEKGIAPLRETLAAAMVYISRWSPEVILADPFCGSGTIPIEAALIGNNIAPGINRRFDFEKWPLWDSNIWSMAKEQAVDEQVKGEFKILASDIDKKTMIKGRQNAERAGVNENIIFQKKPVNEFSSKLKQGILITNPPHGIRMGSDDEVETIYKEMSEVFSKLDGWSLVILSAHERFEQLFGKRSQKNRKIYNGTIKSYIYQYNI